MEGKISASTVKWGIGILLTLIIQGGALYSGLKSSQEAAFREIDDRIDIIEIELVKRSAIINQYNEHIADYKQHKVVTEGQIKDIERQIEENWEDIRELKRFH